MKSKTGKKITGYRYGGYWFGIYRDRISGLSGGSFENEAELLKAYDSANGAGREDGPGLVRVQENGEEITLRKGDNNL